MQLAFFDPSRKLPPQLGMSDCIPAGTSIAEFKNYLAQANIPLHLGVRQVEGPRQKKSTSELLELRSGVEATFIEGKLVWIVASSRKGKQISIFVTDEIAEVVRKAAAEKRVSMSAICSGWVMAAAEAEPAVSGHQAASGWEAARKQQLRVSQEEAKRTHESAQREEEAFIMQREARKHQDDGGTLSSG